MRRISVFGATGSVGQNTMDLIVRDRDAFDVVALTGGGNIERLAKDARAVKASIAVTAFDDRLEDLRAALAGSGIEAAAGNNALVEVAQRPVDLAMSAIVGAAGLAPGLAALEQGATLALANKESMVCAGTLMQQTARDAGARVIPVDSEHSAIFQALGDERLDVVDRVILTASGGAFRDWPVSALRDATPQQAATHPNWDMGQRITIDSASLFNKAMEVIETKEFFGIDPGKIEVVIHPQSLIHALVGFHDGAMLAHVGSPDMRHAIGFALYWPDRKPLPVEPLDLVRAGQFTFLAPDEKRYPALRLARAVMKRGGLSGAVFNAAKERALDAFIAGQIKFTDMAVVVEEVLTRFEASPGLIDAAMTLDNVAQTDHLARQWAKDVMKKRAG